MSLNELRTLGRTGALISPLTLGTLNFGTGTAPTGPADSIRIIKAALDAGITSIDTADIYSQGEAENVVGQAIHGRRDEVFLATKFHGQMGSNPAHAGNSRRWIVRAVEDSLRRLDTDRIDLYQAHRPDYNTDLLETITALNDLIRQGKILYYGTSVFSPAQLVEAQWIANTNHLTPPVVDQVPYSLLVRANERDVFPITQQYGVGVLSYGPLDGGWLAGGYRVGGGQPESSRFSAVPGRFDVTAPFNQAKLHAADALGRVAARYGISLIQLAVAFAMNHPAVTSVIIGPRTEEHLTDYLKAADVVLSEAILDEIDDIVAPAVNFLERDAGTVAPHLEYPELRRR
ncbi:aldo/keto reductase [Paenarthrobacter ureafaciens]|jgi:aryl-alcohol dehydrogenase-like predicted oxidoreductase|uniref:aldo/keto reductase n=1 Tax=Paenarthrobacter TaxID=1742992 RepID=UPI00140A8FB0|nr:MULTISPECIES: aldo/keto reductase [Paenarthrobacter]MBN9128200.1 aldo/keto reductase [Paenarthrobacter ureafaciens]MCW3768850.1 aldo/keto reductase [Paenarthrobacter sp. PAE-2]MCX8456733.1 aldo/keto reductase [Paenarthrobacter ureafaciens]MCY0974378.1 aldo/keto reductase [Paenarthrobacter ureafaciens]